MLEKTTPNQLLLLSYWIWQIGLCSLIGQSPAHQLSEQSTTSLYQHNDLFESSKSTDKSRTISDPNTTANQEDIYLLNVDTITAKDQVLRQNLKVYIDKEGKHTLETIRNKKTIFEENKTTYVTDFSKSIFWVKLPLVGDEKHSAEYLIDCATEQHRWKNITAYLLHENGSIDTIQSGSHLSKVRKPIPSEINLLPLKIEKQEKATLYLRLTGIQKKYLTKAKTPLAIQLTLLAKKTHPGYFEGYPFQGIFYDTQTVFPFTGNELTHQEFYIDQSGTATVAEIMEQWNGLARNNVFNTIHETDKVYWMKARFFGSTHFNGSQILHLAPMVGMDDFSFDYMDIYTVNQKGAYQHHRTGDHIPVEERPFKFWANFIKLELESTDTIDLYVRMEGADKHYLMPKMGLYHIDKTDIFSNQSKEGLYAGLFYGIILFQCIFFTLLFFIERDRLHLYFILMGLGIFAALAFNIISFKSYVLFPNLRDYHLYLFASGLVLSQFGLLKFIATFFNYSKDSFFRKWYITIFFLVFGLITINFLANFQQFLPDGSYYKNTTNYLLFNLATLISLVSGLFMAVKAPPQKEVSKKPFFIAFMPLILLLILFIGVEVCVILNLVDLSQVKNSLLFFSLWDGVKLSVLSMLTLLAVSVGYKNNRLKREKATALRKNLINRQAIREKELQTEKLKEISQLRNRLYTNITHEFRTPLTVIKGMAAQIKVDPEKLMDKGIPMIERNANNLLNLVNQLLDLSKLESGKMKLANQQGNIITYVKYLVESIHSLAASKNILVHFHSEKDLIIMDFDEKKFQQILLNLLSNAIKFTPKNGHIYVSVTSIADSLKEHSGSPTLQIKVRDTGRGIPTNQLPFIFDRFYQVDGTTTRKGEGTGIGLALVKELVDLMKGTIAVKSKVQRETEFTVKLPIYNKAVLSSQPITLPSFSPTIIAAQAAPILSKNAVNQNLTIEQSDKQKVLIIEDNTDVVAYMVSCLENDYSLQVGSNGEEGIEMALQNIPDIIITDIMMPIKDGFEVCETLKADTRTSHIPIIMLTAKADMDSKLAGLEKGADAYLSKPFHPKELLIRLEQLIANRQRLQAKYSTAQLIVEPTPKTEDVFLQSIQKIILENIEKEGFGPEELVQNLGTSRTQLYRKLKALTDMSVANYIKKIKLQEAKRLLIETDKNISEIAYSVGYTSLNYFSNSFSKAFGVSPRKFREQMGDIADTG